MYIEYYEPQNNGFINYDYRTSRIPNNQDSRFGLGFGGLGFGGGLGGWGFPFGGGFGRWGFPFGWGFGRWGYPFGWGFGRWGYPYYRRWFW